MKSIIRFKDYMYIPENDTLFLEGEEEFDDDISDEMDLAMTQLGMYVKWLPIDDKIIVNNSEGEFSFTRDELIKIVKVFGYKEELK